MIGTIAAESSAEAATPGGHRDRPTRWTKAGQHALEIALKRGVTRVITDQISKDRDKRFLQIAAIGTEKAISTHFSTDYLSINFQQIPTYHLPTACGCEGSANLTE